MSTHCNLTCKHEKTIIQLTNSLGTMRAEVKKHIFWIMMYLGSGGKSRETFLLGKWRFRNGCGIWKTALR